MRVALFIDANNLFYTLQDLPFDMDYKKLLDFVRDKHWLEDGYPSIVLRRFYTGVPEDIGHAHIKFLSTIERMGYTVVKRQMKEIISNGKAIGHKADMDGTISFDMADFFHQYDTLVLLAGDSDYERNLRLLAERGKKILIISAFGSVSRELLKLADSMYNVEFVELSSIKHKISRI